MSKKSSKIPPRENKTKEQLKKEAEQATEANRQRQFVEEKLWPYLLKHTKSIKDCNITLQIVKMAIQKGFNNQMLVQTIDEIGILKGIDPKADVNDIFKGFIELFKYEKVGTSIQLIEGLGQATDGFVSKELSERPLSTLKTDFLPFDKNLKPDGTVQTGAKTTTA